MLVTRFVTLFLLVFSQAAAAQTAQVLWRPPSAEASAGIPLPASLPRPADDQRAPAPALWVAGITGSVVGGLAGWNLGHGVARSRGLGERSGTVDLRFPALLVGSAAGSAAGVHFVDRRHGRFSDALAGAILGAVGGFAIAGATSGGDFDDLFVLVPVGEASLATLFSLLGHS